MLGIALIDKPLGLSSHDIVNRVRRVLGLKRIGHAGTLDPLATGLLVVAVGPATRFLQYLSLEPKEYLCQIRFGASTTTQDAEGEIDFRGQVPHDIEVQFENAKGKFLGTIQQMPPMYSAVKKDGKPLYAYARKGIEVERTPRSVSISLIEVEDWINDLAEIRVLCSGGTYMRSLAHDLGLEIGCGAHLAGLRRVTAGEFKIENSVAVEDLTPTSLIDLRTALHPLPEYLLNDSEAKSIAHGQPIHFGREKSSDLVVLVEPTGNVVGIGRFEGPMIRPVCLLPQEVLAGTQ